MHLFDFVGCLSNAMDLVSPAVTGHHRRVGAIASSLGAAAGLTEADQARLVLAGLLHDVGAFSLKDRLDALEFDSTDQTHPEMGARLLEGYPAFAPAASLVRTHHVPWCEAPPRDQAGPDLPLGNLLYLADRVEILLPRHVKSDGPAGVDREALLQRIRAQSGRHFNPAWVEVFADCSVGRGFWDSLEHSCVSCALPHVPAAFNPELDHAELAGLSRFFSRIIDFRCRFTATHSCGVAAVAVALGRATGMPDATLERLAIAGQLHDLGKLGVPSELILKPGALDSQEIAVMRGHAENGYRALAGVPGLRDVALWVHQHHESPSGAGYPAHLTGEDLSVPARVLAVADVFTALAEDRPYRAGMSLNQTMEVMGKMGRSHALDPDLVHLLDMRGADMAQTRQRAQSLALKDFHRFAGGLAQ